MSYAPAYRTQKNDTDEILMWVNDVVEGADVPAFMKSLEALDTSLCDTSDHEAPTLSTPPRNKGGAPPRLPPYYFVAVLKVILEIGFRGETFTWPAVYNALWFRYTEAQLAIIGLAGWRDPERARQMRDAARLTRSATDRDGARRLRVVDDVSARAISAAIKVQHNEVGRLQDAMTRHCRFMDDDALPAGRRHTEKALKDARTPEIEQRRHIRSEFGNLLVQSAIRVAHAMYYEDADPNDPKTGLLRDYRGDVGVDEHQVAVANKHSTTPGTSTAKQMAKGNDHNRQYGFAHVIGMTAGIAVSRADSPKVPAILLAYALHDPTSGAHEGARDVLTSIDSSGLRPTLRGKAHHYVVGDKAYPAYIEFNEWMLANRWTMLGKFRADAAPFTDLAPRGTGPGPFQFNGATLCPGIGAEVLHANAHFDIPWERKNLTPEWLEKNDATVKLLTAAVMPTDGRPKPRKHPGRGRPAADAKPLENTWTLDVFCPAAGKNARVRCRLVSDSLDLPADKFPELKHAPDEDDPKAPECCTSEVGTMKVVLDKKTMKNWQPKMAGSWEHQDIYSPARTATESYFGRLMDRDTGDLDMYKIEWQKSPFVALGIASTIVATNQRVIESWQDDLRTNGGKAPKGLGERRRAHRQRLRGK